eukprot:scaffold131_cov206-Alexandrium_tamarense.AAC.20
MPTIHQVSLEFLRSKGYAIPQPQRSNGVKCRNDDDNDVGEEDVEMPLLAQPQSRSSAEEDAASSPRQLSNDDDVICQPVNRDDNNDDEDMEDAKLPASRPRIPSMEAAASSSDVEFNVNEDDTNDDEDMEGAMMPASRSPSEEASASAPSTPQTLPNNTTPQPTINNNNDHSGKVMTNSPAPVLHANILNKLLTKEQLANLVTPTIRISETDATIWVNVNKTQHPAFELLVTEEVTPPLEGYVWVEWQISGRKEMVLARNVVRNLPERRRNRPERFGSSERTKKRDGSELKSVEGDQGKKKKKRSFSRSQGQGGDSLVLAAPSPAASKVPSPVGTPTTLAASVVTASDPLALSVVRPPPAPADSLAKSSAVPPKQQKWGSMFQQLVTYVEKTHTAATKNTADASATEKTSSATTSAPSATASASTIASSRKATNSKKDPPTHQQLLPGVK